MSKRVTGKKVALVGTAAPSRHMAPVDDLSWDIWGCSLGNSGLTGREVLTRVSAWFEIHSIADMLGMENRSWTLKYYAWLREQTFPVIMQEQNDLVPAAQVYPLELMIKKFGKNWWTSSLAYMMAYAIHLEYDEIAIFGVDMANDEEFYSGQRDSMKRWIEIAEEQGIKVHIPWESSLGKHRPFYGYDEATPMGRRISVLNHLTAKKRAEDVEKRDRLTYEIAFADGVLAQLKYFSRIWLDGSDALAHLNIPDIVKEEAKTVRPKGNGVNYESRDPGATPAI